MLCLQVISNRGIEVASLDTEKVDETLSSGGQGTDQAAYSVT